MSDKIKCPSCGKEIKATAKFCGFCATKIEPKPISSEIKDEYGGAMEAPVGKVCTVCGKKFPPKAKFCGYCSGALVDDTGEDYSEKEHENTYDVCGYVKGNTDEFIDVDDLDKETPKNDEVKMPTATTNIHSDFKPAGDLE